MSGITGHHQLTNRYQFCGKLELITSLKVSSGHASDDTDSPFICDFSEHPYIPGSSLRGAIRSELERILTAVGPDKTGLKSCTLFSNGSCSEKTRDFLKNLDESHADNKDEKILKYVKDKHCDVCKLFGSTVMGTRLFIEDAILNSADSRRVRDCVGIDRDTGAAHTGAKFDYEVMESTKTAPAFFSFCMTLENATTEDKKLVNVILMLLKNGIYVGGKRSGGLGKIKLESYEVKGFEASSDLWNSLIAGSGIETPIKWKEEIQC